MACFIVSLEGFKNTLLTGIGMKRATRPEEMTAHTSSPICKVISPEPGRSVTFPLTKTHPFGLDTSRSVSEGVQQ